MVQREDSDEGNTQLSANGYSYTFDAAGNMLTQTDASGNVTTFTWDNRNRLTSATLKNSSGVTQQVVDYTYDAMNQLIGETVTPYYSGEAGTPTTRRFAYDPLTGEMQLAFDGSGNLTDRYLWGPMVDQVLADEEVESLTSAGTVEWILNDGKGGPRDVWFDGSASLSDHVQYNAWGGIASQTSPSNAPLFGYNGAYTDPATGMQWHNDPNSGESGRWYLPWLQRWASADPIFPLSGSNPFEAFNNSPTNYIDPSGLWVWPWDHTASWNPYDTASLWTGIPKADFPHGVGITGGAVAEAGLAFVGAGAQGSVGAGVFTGQHHVGAYRCGGAFAGTQHGPSWVPDKDGHGALGAFIGGGAGPFLTNATDAAQLAGPFDTETVNIGIGEIKFSVQLAFSGSTWMFSGTYGPGVGIDASEYKTSAVTTK